jgi:hypothetical protein
MTSKAGMLKTRLIDVRKLWDLGICLLQKRVSTMSMRIVPKPEGSAHLPTLPYYYHIPRFSESEHKKSIIVVKFPPIFHSGQHNE